MPFWNLIEINSVLKLAKILVVQNHDINSPLDRAFNSGWKTYLICAIWIKIELVMNLAILNDLNKHFIIPTI